MVDSAGGEIERLLRRSSTATRRSADIVDGWIDLLIVQLASDQRDGCPIEPIATESVNASPQVREASARAFAGWSAAVAERLRGRRLAPTPKPSRRRSRSSR